MLSFIQAKTLAMKPFETFYQAASLLLVPILVKKIGLDEMSSLFFMGPEGFEPTTKGLWVPCATAAP